MISPDRLEAAYQTALAALLKERTPDGHWVGELSTSALSTATAVMALYLVQKHGGESHQTLIDGGLAWLVAHQNEDGGWGDTTISLSNISTTMLCRSAIYLTESTPRLAPAVSRAEAWLTSNYGPGAKWPEAVRQRYGKDRTFATPILTTCALAGLVGWDEVPPLPFELACLPQSWFRFVKLHVVSYALPALIAIGQCIYHHKKPWNPIARFVRHLALAKSLRVLLAIQPSSGGYLEAIPLTSFVTLSLAASGLANHPVVKNAVRFLVNAVRPDGSWAIDSNLATWVTTLSINALAAAGELDQLDRKDKLRDWLLNQQYKERHPYTGADPGGWAWTDLPGGVPDADDTPGAILALTALSEPEALAKNWAKSLAYASGSEAIAWLYGLQNRDGGIPTFCRGWGHLPFDRSGTDLTAHMIRTFGALFGADFACRIAHRDIHSITVDPRAPWMQSIFLHAKWMLPSALAYLARTQRPDGSWLPLWFGNQHMPDDENPTYGTARVLAAYRDLGMMNTEPARCGIAWLLANQNPNGGWGGGKGTPSSMEETALAIDVLIDAGEPSRVSGRLPGDDNRLLTELGSPTPVNKGIAWLVEKVEQGGLSHPSPIGFYFAKLWYFEKLYPIIFTVSALGRARKSTHRSSHTPV
jgi:squalene-hopene/tetraprenyl-beta-curcumene cyclase